MKRNLFLIVFIIFASTIFYKYGRPKSHAAKQVQVTNKVIAPTPRVNSLVASHFPPKTHHKMPKEKPTPPPRQVIRPILSQLQKVDVSLLKGALRDYAELKNQALNAIPPKTELREEVKTNPHLPSPKLIKAGKKLGALKSFILKYPDNLAVQKEARQFYEQCATYSEYPNSIRSLCLYNRRALAKNSGKKFDISPYPENIRKIIQNPAM